MTSVLRQARKRRLQIKEEQRVSQDIELQSYLNQLIIKDAEESLALIKEEETKDPESTAEIDFASKRKEIEEKKESSLTKLNDLFAKVDERRRVSINFYLFILFFF